MRLRSVWFGVYFLAALLPRLAAVLHGAVFADDLWHGPSGHVVSLRFLNVAELAFWQALFGADYLLGAWPKIITSLYTAALCSVLRVMLLRFQIAAICATLVPLLIPLHPIWNTFLMWNATGVYVLSLFLVVLGYDLLTRDRVVFGVIAIAVGVSGYQVHAGLLPALFVFELAMRKREMPWLRRGLACAAGVALYGLAIVIATLGGVKAWGNRGIGSARGDTWRGMVDNLAILCQPFLSYWISEPVAWRWWRAPFVLLSAITALAARWLAVLPIAMPVLAAAVVLPLNVVVTGPRVAGAIWVALVLSVVPLLMRASRNATIATIVIFAIVAIPICIADTDNRVRAWRADLEIRDSIAKYWAGAPHSIFVERTNIPSRAKLSRPIVLQNYRAVTMLHHSNVIVCPAWFFANYAPEPRGSNWERGGANEIAVWEHDRAARVTRVRVLASPRLPPAE